LNFITAEEALEDLEKVLDESCWGGLGCPQGHRLA
jgi:hypothetical protein